LPVLAVAVMGKERALGMGPGMVLEMVQVMGPVLETGPEMGLEQGLRRQQPDRPAVSRP